MAVVFDAKSTSATDATGVTTVTHNNLTIGSGSNRALVVTMVTQNNTTAESVTWNGVNVPLIQKDNSEPSQIDTTLLFGLVNPASGNNSLVATWTGASDVEIGAVSFTGVDQTGGTTTFNHVGANGGTSTAASVAITSTAQDAVVGVYVTRRTISAVSDSTLFTSSNVNPNCQGGANYAVNSGSTTLTATVGAGGGNWGAAATNVLAASTVLTTLQSQICM